MRSILFTTLLLVGCGTPPQSRIKYLNEGDYKCYEPTAARLAEVNSLLPAGFISPSFGSQSSSVLSRLAGIPTSYLQHLVDRYNNREFSGVAPGNLGGGVAGLTKLQGTSFDEMYATSITVRMDAIDFALQHEVGHAVETFVKLQAREKKFDFETGFQTVFKEALATPGVRSYARSSDKESWAEAFANFYCSPESKEFIDGGAKHKGMASSSTFLSQVLMLPQWLMGGSDNPKEPSNPLEDVFVELKSGGSSGDDVILNISSLPEVATFEICKPEVDRTCKAASEYYQKIENSQERSSRKFFLSQTPVQIKSDLNILLVGRDSAGKVIALRQIKFNQK